GREGERRTGPLLRQAIMTRAGAPHQPAIVLRVAGLQTKQAALAGRDINPALGHRGWEDDRLPEVDAPQLHAMPGRQTVYLAIDGADEHFAVHNHRRRQHTVEQLALALLLVVRLDDLEPGNLLCLRIDALQRVAHCTVEASVGKERPRPLI